MFKHTISVFHDITARVYEYIAEAILHQKFLINRYPIVFRKLLQLLH